MRPPWPQQSTQKAAISPSTIARPKTVFIRKPPTSLHNRSVNKIEDVGRKAFFNQSFADLSLDFQVIVLKVLAVPVELKSAHSTAFP